MEYKLMGAPFDFENFESLTKKQTEEYFQWYLAQIEGRLEQLEKYIQVTEPIPIIFDYSVESLIPLWEWYETRIIVENKTIEEINEDMLGRPDWMKGYISETKISLETWKFGMDVAIYFAEVFRKHNPTIYWGYFTKPKSRVSLNRPVLLGFIKGMDLDPRRIVKVMTMKSSRERKKNRMYEVYYVWLKHIEE